MAFAMANSCLLLTLLLSTFFGIQAYRALGKQGQVFNRPRGLINGLELTGFDRDRDNIAGSQGNVEDINLRVVLDAGGGYHVEDVNGRYEVVNDGRGWYHLNGKGSANGYKFHVSRDTSGKYSIDNNDNSEKRPVDNNNIEITIIEDHNGGYKLKPEGNFRIVDDGNGWYHTEGEGIYNGQKFRVIREPNGSFAIEWQKRSNKTLINLGQYNIEFSVDNNGKYHLIPKGNFRIVNDGNDWYHPEGAGIPPGYKIHVVRGPDGNFEVQLKKPRNRVIGVGPYQFELNVDDTGNYYLTPRGNFKIISDGDDWYHLEGDGVPPGTKFKISRDQNGEFLVKWFNGKPTNPSPNNIDISIELDEQGRPKPTVDPPYFIVSQPDGTYLLKGPGLEPGKKFKLSTDPNGQPVVTWLEGETTTPSPNDIKITIRLDDEGRPKPTVDPPYFIVSQPDGTYLLKGPGLEPGKKFKLSTDPNGQPVVTWLEGETTTPSPNDIKITIRLDDEGRPKPTVDPPYFIVSQPDGTYLLKGPGLEPGKKFKLSTDPNGQPVVTWLEGESTTPSPNNVKVTIRLDDQGRPQPTVDPPYFIVSQPDGTYLLKGPGLEPGKKFKLITDPNGQPVVTWLEGESTTPSPNNVKVTIRFDDQGRPQPTVDPPYFIVSQPDGTYLLKGPGLEPGKKFKLSTDPSGQPVVTWLEGESTTPSPNNVKVTIRLDDQGRPQPTVDPPYFIVSQPDGTYLLKGPGLEPGKKFKLSTDPNGQPVVTWLEWESTTPSPNNVKITIRLDGEGQPKPTVDPPYFIVSQPDGTYLLKGPGLEPGKKFKLSTDPNGQPVVTWLEGESTTPSPNNVKVTIRLDDQGRPQPTVDPPYFIVSQPDGTYLLKGPGLEPGKKFKLSTDPNGQPVVTWLAGESTTPSPNNVKITIRFDDQGRPQPTVDPPYFIVSQPDGTYLLKGPGLEPGKKFKLSTDPNGQPVVTWLEGESTTPSPNNVKITIRLDGEGQPKPTVDPPYFIVSQPDGTYLLKGPGLEPGKKFKLSTDPNGQPVVTWLEGETTTPSPNNVKVTIRLDDKGRPQPTVDPPYFIVSQPDGTYLLKGPGLEPGKKFKLSTDPNGQPVVTWLEGESTTPSPNNVKVTIRLDDQGRPQPTVDPPYFIVSQPDGTYLLKGPGLEPGKKFKLSTDPNGQPVVTWLEGESTTPSPNNVKITIRLDDEGRPKPTVDPPYFIVSQPDGTYLLKGPGLEPGKKFKLSTDPSGQPVVTWLEGESTTPSPNNVKVTIRLDDQGRPQPTVDPPYFIVSQPDGTYLLKGPGLEPGKKFKLSTDPNGQPVVTWLEGESTTPSPNNVKITIRFDDQGRPQPTVDPPYFIVSQPDGTYLLKGPGLEPGKKFKLSTDPNGQPVVTWLEGESTTPSPNNVKITIRLDGEGQPKPTVDPPYFIVSQPDGTYLLKGPGLEPGKKFKLSRDPNGQFFVTWLEGESRTPSLSNIKVTIRYDENGRPIPIVDPPYFIASLPDGTYLLNGPGFEPGKKFKLRRDPSGQFVVTWLEGESTTPSPNNVKVTIRLDDQGRPQPTVDPPYFILSQPDGTYLLKGPGLEPGKKFKLSRDPNGQFFVTWLEGESRTPSLSNIKVTIRYDENGRPIPIVDPPYFIASLPDGTYLLNGPGFEPGKKFKLRRDPGRQFVVTWLEGESTTPSPNNVKVTIRLDDQGRPQPTVDPPYFIVSQPDGTYLLKGPGLETGKKFKLSRDPNGQFFVTWLEGMPTTVSPNNIKITIRVDENGRPKPIVDPPYFIASLPDGTYLLNGPGFEPGKKFKLSRGPNGQFTVFWLEGQSTTPSLSKIKITIRVDELGRPLPTVDPPYVVVRQQDGTYVLNGPAISPGKKFKIVKNQDGKFVINWLL